MERATTLFGARDQADSYAAHRPSYPPALLRSICDYAADGLGRRPAHAVDAACGSGQAALTLARAEPGLAVVALDGAPAQVAAARAAVARLQDAGLASRLSVLHADAQDTGLPAASADLVTIAQALHWVDVPRFYAEAARLLVPGGCVAVLSYTWPSVRAADGRPLPASSAAVRAAAYAPPLGGRWDAGRAAVDAGLPGADPPGDLYEAVERRGGGTMTAATTPAGVAGYVRSWSAHAAWRRECGGGGGGGGEEPPDPAAAVEAAVAAEAGGGGAAVVLEWPVLVLVGRKRRGEVGGGGGEGAE